MKRNSKVSTAVIRRLPRYYRQLSELQRKGVVRISSSALGKSMGLTASQIRQDLFCFGGFGQQGYGYKVDGLKEQIGEILGINRGHTIVVLGAGNLGRALIENFKFSSNGFQLLAAFDVQERTVGTQIAGVPVYHADTLEAFLTEHPVNVGLLTVPKSVWGSGWWPPASGASGTLPTTRWPFPALTWWWRASTSPTACWRSAI